MRLLVCIKQVPTSLEVAISAASHTLERSFSQAVPNPFDLYALEAAARIKEQFPDTHITALCMGAKDCVSALKDAVSLCADEAYLVSDDALAGADFRMTADVLARAIGYLEKTNGRFDWIFTGEKSTDAGLGMMAQGLAARLGRPAIAQALTICASERDNEYLVTREGETADDLIAANPPCVIAFTKAPFAVRYPDIARILSAEQMKIETIHMKALYSDADRLPLAGIRVRSFRYRRIKKGARVIKGAPNQAAERLFSALRARRLV